jgi:hypothetical protein
VRSSQAALIVLDEDEDEDEDEGDVLPPLNVTASRLIGQEVHGDAIRCSRAEAGVGAARVRRDASSAFARQPEK